MYISVQNELTAAYNELRNEAAINKYNLNYTELPKDKQKEIRKMYPMKISEAPLANFNKNNMSKFKKNKKGGTPAISTASLPDIVFMYSFSW